MLDCLYQTQILIAVHKWLSFDSPIPVSVLVLSYGLSQPVSKLFRFCWQNHFICELFASNFFYCTTAQDDA